MRGLAVACAVTAATAWLWIGCTVWNDAEPPSDAAAPPADAQEPGVDAGCQRATVETKGPAPSEGTGGDIDVVVAVKSISLGVENGKVNPDFGYDLDGVCAPSCVPRSDAGALPKDGNLGRDDGLGTLVGGLPINPAQYANDSFATGDLGIIARIQGYNGLPTDDDIVFSIYRSSGVPTAPPNFDDPNQQWKIDTTDLKAGAAGDDYTANTNGHGFVRNGHFVVPQLASSKIPFNGDSDILLQRVSFTGDLVKAGAVWTVKNAIGVGRWDVMDALQTIAHVQDPQNSKQRICKNPLLLAGVRTLTCNSVDLNLTQDGDGAICNALSAAVAFEAVPAKLGPKDTPLREEACAGIPIGGCE